MFDESKHPRADDGKFTSSDGAGGTHEATEAEKRRLKDLGIDENENNSDHSYNSKPQIDKGLVQFAQDAIDGKIKPTDYYVVGKISDRQRADIERLTGEKLNAAKNTITVNQIQHIEKRHGTHGKADQVMSDLTNYGLMNYILETYDTAELATVNGKPDLTRAYIDKDGKNAKQIIFKKKDKNTYFVVEAITDNKKTQDIKIMTMYIKNTD